MSDLFENAINSIKLGIEDFKSNDERRPVSAVRNFYAGVLLLGKQCLIDTVPEAEPMEVLASKYVPVPDDDGGVMHEAKGYRTIDIFELQERFKSFDLKWPDGEILGLQKLRNDFEHYHSPAPKEAIRQAIAGCFPLVEGFFHLLGEDPASSLEEAWDVMLAEEAFFKKKKADCDTSFNSIPWGQTLDNADMIQCTKCGSSLIYQLDDTNADPASIKGKCMACGQKFAAEQTVEIIVEGEYRVDDYIMTKDGGEQAIYTCPECAVSAYVFFGEVNQCYFCDASVSGECGLCGEGLNVVNQSVNDSTFCDCCYHKMEKVMDE